MEPQYSEPLNNQVLGMTDDFLNPVIKFKPRIKLNHNIIYKTSWWVYCLIILFCLVLLLLLLSFSFFSFKCNLKVLKSCCNLIIWKLKVYWSLKFQFHFYFLSSEFLSKGSTPHPSLISIPPHLLGRVAFMYDAFLKIYLSHLQSWAENMVPKVCCSKDDCHTSRGISWR